MQQLLWKVCGSVSFALGVAGIVLPLVPTTPFLLLAAWCWLRGSPEWYAWLIGHPRYGPPIRDWHEHRSISRRTKITGVVIMVLMVALSFALGVPSWALGLQALILVCVALILVTRPEPPTDR